MSPTTRCTITPPTAADLPRWQDLYRAYTAGAGADLDEDHLARVWSWIGDPVAQTQCLLLRAAPDAPAVGLAHYRAFERPMAGSIGCYLDDLFVEQDHRGRGAARALLEHLAAMATEYGWSTVRWTTGQDNDARHLYDRLAHRSPVITYNMTPAERCH